MDQCQSLFKSQLPAKLQPRPTVTEKLEFDYRWTTRPICCDSRVTQKDEVKVQNLFCGLSALVQSLID